MKVCLKNRTENSVNNKYKIVSRNFTRFFLYEEGESYNLILWFKVKYV
jgi:hypothetical protein